MSNSNDFVIENGVLVRYSGSDETLVIPEGVTSVGIHAVVKKQALKKVIIPEGVKTIEREAFLWNPQLEEVCLPGSLETIGNSAFSGHGNLRKVETALPSRLKSIGFSAFQGCIHLKEINVPQQTAVSAGAFAGCVGLADENGWLIVNDCLFGYYGEKETITIPENVTVIGPGAFSRSGITEVFIPDNVGLVKNSAFDSCIKLTKVRIPEQTAVEDGAFISCRGFADSNGMVIFCGSLYGYYGNNERIVIPDGTSRIAAAVFCNRDNICSVTFPEGLESIGESAFGNCGGLSEIELPKSLITIGKNAFSRTSLKSIEIPQNTAFIGEEAFGFCKWLESVVLQGNKTVVSDTAFKGCDRIRPNEDGFIIVGHTLYRYLGTKNNVTVPDGITTIGVNAFNNRNNVTSVKLPDSITVIKDTAFAYCSRLESIVLPNGIKTLDTCTFINCSSLTSVVLPASLTNLGSSVFSGCSSLTSIILPKECRSIGYKCFSNCCNLKRIDIDGVITEVGEEAFTGCSNLVYLPVDPALITETDAKIIAALSWINEPDKLQDAAHKEETKKYAFSKKKRILPVIFTNDMAPALRTFAENGKITKKNVDEEFLTPAMEAHATQCIAFLMDWKCENVSSKDASKAVEMELTKDPFNATDMKKIWSFKKLEDGTLEITSYKGDKTAITVPGRIGNDPVSRIGDSAISPLKKGRPQAQAAPLLGIKSVVISEGIIEIGREAFSGCDGLVSVILPDSLQCIDQLAFEGCSSLSDINLSDSVRILGSAFSGCKGLADADGYVIIKGFLCAYTGNAKELTVPDGVRSIGIGAFKDNTALIRVRLPESVGYIGASAFAGCTALEEVTIPNDCAYIGGNAFHNCRKLRAVYVPKGSTTESYAKGECKKVKYI